MLTGIFLFLHAVFCVLLITVILMQSGRGGGLTEGFASAETMFGAKTNEFMVRLTIILGCLYLVTSLSLARMSSQKEESLMSKTAADRPSTSPSPRNIPETPPESVTTPPQASSVPSAPAQHAGEPGTGPGI